LDEYADYKPERLSGGFKRRLMIARAVVHEPRVVFLDEPTTGLDPQARVAVWELIHGLREEGMAVVLTTHYMDEAERLSDRLQVLQAGRVRAAGTTRHVLGDIVGEHVVLLPAVEPVMVEVTDWLKTRGAKPAQVLAHWHVALDASGLAAFVAQYPELRYEVRPPTLDDLFLALSQETLS
jgi:lipooligosaccharide transport system ATP-binding protein